MLIANIKARDFVSLSAKDTAKKMNFLKRWAFHRQQNKLRRELEKQKENGVEDRKIGKKKPSKTVQVIFAIVMAVGLIVLVSSFRLFCDDCK
jgi:hypothetical protein